MSQTDVVDVGQNDKARDHPDNKQKPPPSGVQEYSAQIWFSDQIEKETKVVSASLFWTHVLGNRSETTAYFEVSGDVPKYIKLYETVNVLATKLDTKTLKVRGY